MRPVLLLVALWAAGAQAEEHYAALFDRAVDAIDYDFQEDWAYTETIVTSDHVWIGHYDPRRAEDERWKLLTVDDRQPTEEEVKDYRKDQKHEHAEAGDERVEAMVSADSIRLLAETDAYWLFAFEPEDQEDAFLESVDATFRIIKNGGHFDYIEIRNHEPVKPGFTVRISKLLTRLTFGPASPDGPIVPLSSHVEVKGRAFLLISFDEQEIRHRRNFEFAGE